MACETLVELDEFCPPNVGGMKALYYNDTAAVTAKTLTSGKITAATVTTPFIPIPLLKDQAEIKQSRKINLENGSTYVEASVEFSIKGSSTEKEDFGDAASAGQRYISFVGSDNQGKHWLVEYTQMATEENTTGKAKADGAHYDFTFMAENATNKTEIDAAALDDFLA